ncbi:hypothetical protein RI129_001978 [Pyrocoelia pectoralis]|uniref:Serpin domain-containing protein n=1 Tax=Pyrocoelia pectoralis TaxID=417401 RepID=A0AAN7VVW7_9COLE
MLLIIIFASIALALPTPENNDSDGQVSRKVLGSSVVTSVSVIMDSSNGSQTFFADAVGKPMTKPLTATQLASPINLLNPDRYEFYTFDDSGDLVRRLMTLDEIQGIIASGDGDSTNYNSQSLLTLPEQRVDDVINNVQNVLKEEMESHKPVSDGKPEFDTPDVTSTWNLILPALFGNPDSLVPDFIAETVPPSTTTNAPKTTIQTLTTQNSIPTQTITVSEANYAKTESPSATNTESINENLEKSSSTTPSSSITEITDAPTTATTVSQTFEKTENLSTVLDELAQNFDITTEGSERPLTATAEPTTKESLPSQEEQATTTENFSKLTSEITKESLSSQDEQATTTESFPKLITTFEIIKESLSSKDEQATTTESISKLTTFEITTELASTENNMFKEKTTTLAAISATTEEQTTRDTSLMMSTTPIDVITTAIKSEAALNSTTQQESTTDRQIEELTTFAMNSKYTVNSGTTTESAPTTIEMVTAKQSPNLVNNEITTQFPTSTVTMEAQSATSPNLLNKDSAFESPTSTTTVEEGTLKFTTSTEIVTEYLALVTIQERLSTESSAVNESQTHLSNVGSTTDLPMSTKNEPLKDIGSTSFPISEDSTPAASTTENIPNANDVSTTTMYGTTTLDSVTMTETLNTTEKETFGSTTDSFDTTTNYILHSNKVEFDENVNDAVDNLISQIINRESNQTTIENLLSNEDVTEGTTIKLQETTRTSDMSENAEMNRYEEIELDNIDLSTPVSYEEKNIQLWQNMEELKTTFKELTSTEANIDSTTPYIKNETSSSSEPVPNTTNIPYKNLKTDAMELDNFEITTALQVSAKLTATELSSEMEDNSTEVYYLTELSPDKTTLAATAQVSEVANETTTELSASTEAEVTTTRISEPTTAPASAKISSVKTEGPTTSPTLEFVTVETVTSPSAKVEKPELHIINRTISTTAKSDTTWTLVSTVAPHRTTASSEQDKLLLNSVTSVDLVPKPLQGFGLSDSTSALDPDVFQFTELCNELAFSFWSSVTSGISFARSVVVSPFATTSVLAMVFLGARGATSGEMNEILKLDDMVTFNPHAVFKNVVESIEVSKKSGVANSVFVKELYSDKNKGKLLNFYKERVKQFYDGHVEEVNFKEINDVVRRRTNLLVKRQTWGKVTEYLKDNNLSVRPPLAAISANLFQTDCSKASVNGRDGELHFVVLPSIRQRKLVPIPAVVWRSEFLAGYEPGLDATAVAIGRKDQTISTIFVIPGQQGISAPGDGLARLETRLIESAFKQNAWARLLRSLIPRPGLEVQIPRFSHKSIINATAALQRMGLRDLFNAHTADLKGLNGVAHDLYLSDIIQINTFATCGENKIDDTHHSEIYPATTNRSFRRVRKIPQFTHYENSDLADEPRDYQRAFHDPLYDPSYLSLPLQFRPRQARLPEAPRLRFDRPFLYFVRHNPTGLLLHMGRFNPRLLP